ncbi:MAG: ATP-binding cassette domain-containing protein [Candidatus Methylumidiphilus sp.]
MQLEMNVKINRGRFGLATDLSVNNTDIGVLGASGAGKTTLLGLIAGTLQPESGHIALDGQILFNSRKDIMLPARQRPVGAVLQQDIADMAEPVGVGLAAAYKKIPKRQRLLTPAFLTESLELGATLDRPSPHLSAGERQRVAVALALLKSPKLLLLDDTFAIIGNAQRDKLLSVLRAVQHETGMRLAYASQSLGDLLEVTDHVAILDAGKMVGSGSLRELAQAHGFLRYLGMHTIENILPVRIESHDRQGGCTLASLFGIPLILPMRPHLALGSQTQVSIKSADIALSRSHLSGISIQNQIKGRVCALVPSGEKVFVQIDCGSIVLAEITLRALADMQLQEGDTVYCLAKTHAVEYISEVDARASNRAIRQSDGYYFLDATSINGGNGAREC